MHTCTCGHQIASPRRRCPACRELIDPKDAKLARIAAKIAADDRLIGWLVWLRIDGETGLGDTAERLLAIAKPDTAKRIRDLVTTCSCDPETRREHWNKLHPYCTVCHKPATTVCSYTLSLGMCGVPLCNQCKHPHAI